MAEVGVPGSCPTCQQRDLRRHCPDSIRCTWNECGTCMTLLDRRTGRFIAQTIRKKDAQ